MGRITITQRIEADRAVVWGHLSDLASHPDWMKDAMSLEFISPTTTGVGTTMRVPTRVGPFVTKDILEVVSWVPGESIGVVHRGLVVGTGEFRLDVSGTGTVLTWDEDLRFPWWLGGPITAWLAGPVLQSIWRSNLKRFARLVVAE